MFSNSKKNKSDAYTIVGLWVVALVTTFLLVGANSRPILWVFVLGGGMSYYILTKKK